MEIKISKSARPCNACLREFVHEEQLNSLVKMEEQQLIREDIRDLTGIKSIEDIETLYLLLPSKIGSPLSAMSLANDLRVSYNSVRNWLTIFERFFLAFSISPWTTKIARAIQKERKV